MKPKQKKYGYFTIAIICAVSLLTLTVFGSYVGRGSKKGVLVASSYYFESDVLGDVTETTNASLNNIPVICAKGTDGTTTKAINIRNYKNLAFDTFDITYEIRIWLSETDSGNYEYYYRFNNVDPWNAIDNITLAGLTLTGGNIDSDRLEIQWVWTGEGTENIALAKTVYVTAEPTSPENLISKKLGAALSLGMSSAASGFSIDYGFVSPAQNYQGSLKEFAGLKYGIKVNGTPPEGKTVTLSWNNTKIYLSPLNKDIDINNVIVDQNTSSITIAVKANASYSIVFYRQYPGWTEADEGSLPTVTYALSE